MPKRASSRELGRQESPLQPSEEPGLADTLISDFSNWDGVIFTVLSQINKERGTHEPWKTCCKLLGYILLQAIDLVSLDWIQECELSLFHVD